MQECNTLCGTVKQALVQTDSRPRPQAHVFWRELWPVLCYSASTRSGPQVAGSSHCMEWGGMDTHMAILAYTELNSHPDGEGWGRGYGYTVYMGIFAEILFCKIMKKLTPRIFLVLIFEITRICSVSRSVIHLVFLFLQMQTNLQNMRK